MTDKPEITPEAAARLLEYLDRCPLGGPGTPGMHRERIEMNQLCDGLIAVINYQPPPPEQEIENERTEEETAGEA